MKSFSEAVHSTGTALECTSLEWGIKESFRNYFERLPDHRYVLTEGARRCSDGQIEFPANEGQGGDGKTLIFRGIVQLSAHYGALSVRIANPHVWFSDDGRAVLSAEVDELAGEPVRMNIANLIRENSFSSRDFEWIFRTELAEEGQYLFMGNYFAGEVMDPVTVWFAAP